MKTQLSKLFVHPVDLKILSGPRMEPDEDCLVKLLKAMFDAPTLDELKRMIWHRQLYAYETPRGVVLLETVDWKRGRELRVYGITGKDVLRCGKEIVDDLRSLATYYGCVMIGGEGVPKGWLRAAPKLGFRPVSTHFLMEL